MYVLLFTSFVSCCSLGSTDMTYSVSFSCTTSFEGFIYTFSSSFSSSFTFHFSKFASSTSNSNDLDCYYRNNDTISKKVDDRSKTLELSKNTIKQIKSSILIPTNFVFTLLLYCQIFGPAIHFFLKYPLLIMSGVYL